MKKTVNVADAKAHLSEILGKVAAGQEIVITRCGVTGCSHCPREKSAETLVFPEGISRENSFLRRIRQGINPSNAR